MSVRIKFAKLLESLYRLNKGKSMTTHPLSGVYVAAITPLNGDFSPDLEAIPGFLCFLAKRGCHGALLLGTTGEGPSFAAHERLAIFQAALEVRQEYPDFGLLAGTGTPSLTETISLTRSAFDLGFNGVVTLPPYYYHQATTDGIYAWFREIINRAVPRDGYILGYHFPTQSGVPLSLDLLSHLKDSFPNQFAGIKDSSGDPEHSKVLGERFGSDLVVLVGSDALLSHSLKHKGSGCITAMANLYSPDLRTVWDAYQQGKTAPSSQERLTTRRNVLLNYAPYPPTIKALIENFFEFPHWVVRPPLLRLPIEKIKQAIRELTSLG
jgi:4-hydroxy-tetrahydrodipicolinate synthase